MNREQYLRDLDEGLGIEDEYLREHEFVELKRLSIPKHIHVMNKNESKMLRKIKATTGLSEKEIREHKKYRVMLSSAQDKGEKSKRGMSRHYRKMYKILCGHFKLPKEHPTIQEAVKKIEQENSRGFWSTFRIERDYTRSAREYIRKLTDIY